MSMEVSKNMNYLLVTINKLLSQYYNLKYIKRYHKTMDKIVKGESKNEIFI